jgi:3-mercaptopyruvate sulfurtransferase SseA
LIIVIGVALLLVAAFVLIRKNQQTQARLATPFPVIPTAAAEETFPEIARVSLTDAKTAFDQGSAVFVDVRAVSAYQASHVKGAINIPLAEIPNGLKNLKQEDWIITYCT